MHWLKKVKCIKDYKTAVSQGNNPAGIKPKGFHFSSQHLVEAYELQETHLRLHLPKQGADKGKKTPSREVGDALEHGFQPRGLNIV